MPHLSISSDKNSSNQLWMKIYKDVLNPWLPKSPSLLKNKFFKEEMKKIENTNSLDISKRSNGNEIKNQLDKLRVSESSSNSVAGKAFKIKRKVSKIKKECMVKRKFTYSFEEKGIKKKKKNLGFDFNVLNLIREKNRFFPIYFKVNICYFAR
jgi:ribosomal protein S6E (S10)